VTQRLAPPVAQLTPVPRNVVHRRCSCGIKPGEEGACAECSRKAGTVARKPHGSHNVDTVPASVGAVVRSSGQPLGADVRGFMESRFERDFSGVRVHADGAAAESARAIDAAAYTVGRDVVFGANQFEPETAAGRQLLAHELAHVTQQAGQSEAATGGLQLGSPTGEQEAQADRAAEAVMGTRPVSDVGAPRTPAVRSRRCERLAGSGCEP
jgi:hypothetical protein